MALRIGRRKATDRGGGQKAAVLTDEARTVIQNFGGVPFGGDYSRIYRSQPAVRTVIDYRARNVASLNIKVFLRAGDDDRQEMDGSALAQILRDPNPATSRYRHWHDTVADLGLYDVAYWFIDRPYNPRSITRIPVPSIQRRSIYLEAIPVAVEYWNRHTGKQIPRENLIILSGYSPEGLFENDDGVSPIETLRTTLEEMWNSQQNRRRFWKNAARQGGVIKRPADAPEWSDPARERFRADWDATMTGEQNAGRTALLEDGMDFMATAFSPKDAEYITGQELSFNTVCHAYGINPTLFTGGATHSNVTAYHQMLYQDTFGPLLVQLQDEIEFQLLPLMPDVPPASAGRIYTEFNIAEKLKMTFEDEMKVLTTTAGVPIVTVNEARARLDLPKIEGEGDKFDIPVMPQNVIYGGQPSQNLPTAVPQPGGGAPPPGLNPKPVVNEPQPQLPPGKRVRSGQKKTVPRAALKRQEDAVKEHKVLFERYFRAQRRAVKSAKAAGAPFDMERWNSRLSQELFTARSKLAKKTGALAAKQIRGVYDPSLTNAYLADTALAEAEGINQSTAADLAKADNPDDVFDIAETSRALALAIGTATAIIGFARVEAAKQSVRNDGVMRRKTWVVTSHNSRHPELDGETVDMWDADGNESTFSNGARWPGDPAAGPDQSAGCQCLADLLVG